MPRFLCLVLLVSGCSTLAGISSGQVGCPQEEILISDKTVNMTGGTWTATCRNQRWFCSSHSGGEDSTAQVSCAPEAGGPPGGANAVPAAADGCEYDTQCKGERVCVEGACVDPAPASTPGETQ